MGQMVTSSPGLPTLPSRIVNFETEVRKNVRQRHNHTIQCPLLSPISFVAKCHNFLPVVDYQFHNKNIYIDSPFYSVFIQWPIGLWEPRWLSKLSSIQTVTISEVFSHVTVFTIPWRLYELDIVASLRNLWLVSQLRCVRNWNNESPSRVILRALLTACLHDNAAFRCSSVIQRRISGILRVGVAHFWAEMRDKWWLSNILMNEILSL